MASKPKCKYAAKCYRKNPKHLRDFDHLEAEESPVDDKVEVEEDEEEDDDNNGSHGNAADEVGDTHLHVIDENLEGDKDKRLKRKHDRTSDGDSDSDAPKLIRKNSKVTRKQCTTLDAFFGRKDKIEDPGHASADVNTVRDSTSTSTSTSNFGKLDTEVASLKASESEEEEISPCDDTTTKPVQTTFDKKIISDMYGMKMPDDLYHFWDFCKTVNTESPCLALQVAGLRLVGPYDTSSTKHKETDTADVSIHLNYRYYYDPPEFMTLIMGNDKQFHLGYFRDDPEELPAFVGSNSADENCLISPRGENIFSAVKWYLDDRLKRTKEKAVSKILTQLCDFANEKKICLDLVTPKLKQRQKKVVCKTFHGAGLVVPVDKNDVGYRPVPETPADLKKMLKKIVESESEEERNIHLEPLEEIITYIQFANDECDYGEGVELGLDLFSYGSDVLHPFISSLLCMGYKLLKRNIFAEIIRGFLPVRKRNKPNVLTQ